MRVLPGNPYPLGATWDGLGTNFAIFSENAEKIELALFDSPEAAKESRRITLPEQTDQIWHVFLPDVAPGQLYGYRVYGPYDPQNGMRFNPAKIMLDPYAKAIGRRINWDDSLFGYRIGDPAADLSCDDRDNAAFAPLAAVVDNAFTWGDDRLLRHPWHKTIIYEAHVKGLTMLHPDVPAELRGTYAGLATEPVLNHFKALGITAVELMPVHHHADDRHLIERGLSNYWGYNTLSFLAPDIRYAAAQDPLNAVREFKRMVRALHQTGIEVILDVVYNHTAEGNHLGPTLSLRGIDNASYYRLRPEARYYVDYTGCGNTLNMRHPQVLQLIMDSLRYWVTEMHVDGFRFDLASTLARELHEVDKLGAFFDIIRQDPVLSQVKLIAEPWDLGEGGYQVGNFPVGWTEWNGKYRDAMRHYWKSDDGWLPEFATRFAGSSDLYSWSGRKPYASINFITAHDGFTLQDLVSYNEKHNEANGEENGDGDNNNLSWNCGHEGPADDEAVARFREQQKRNLLATLLLSQGVPMILAGDEMGRTQGGNNNAYCQDNEVSWVNWKLDVRQKEFLEFSRWLIQFRKRHAVFQRRRFFYGQVVRNGKSPDIVWLDPDSVKMTEEAWNAGYNKCLGILLAGNALADINAEGDWIVDQTFMLLFNAHYETLLFKLPDPPDGYRWQRLFTSRDHLPNPRFMRKGIKYELHSRSLTVFRAIKSTYDMRDGA